MNTVYPGAPSHRLQDPFCPESGKTQAHDRLHSHHRSPVSHLPMMQAQPDPAASRQSKN